MSDTNVAKTDARSTEAERAETGVMLPPVDVIEDAAGITLFADLPGVPRDKLNLNVEADTLTIEGGPAVRRSASPSPCCRRPLHRHGHH